ncbi:hypothetical protein [Streptomyces triticirhizae]|uniref:Uncharacterized protein n=1 Tax=Streptomyces triticirhizae TaxID=2483353 RepID=A0A3M2KUK5_9ACTN|nr:hypothetical protein [Streptomyces triticirhizae]RMI28644.1 hypothetical protein EBN88_28135 [Streptomyces triticirhizae]
MTLKVQFVPDTPGRRLDCEPRELSGELLAALADLGIEHVHVVRRGGRLDAIIYFLADRPLTAEREICDALARYAASAASLAGMRVDVCELDFYLTVGMPPPEAPSD